MDMKGGGKDGIMMWKSKGRMDTGEQYNVGNQRVDAKWGNMMCKLKGRMNKGGHYDVEMKRWMQKGAL